MVICLGLDGRIQSLGVICNGIYICLSDYGNSHKVVLPVNVSIIKAIDFNGNFYVEANGYLHYDNYRDKLSKIDYTYLYDYCQEKY